MEASNCEIIQTIAITIEALAVIVVVFFVRQSYFERELKKIDKIVGLANDVYYHCEKNVGI